MFKSFALCALAGVASAWGGYGGNQYGVQSYGGHNIHGTKSAAGRRSAGSFGRGSTVRAHSGQGGQAGLSGGYGRFAGANIHGTISAPGRRSVGNFGQGATVRGHSGDSFKNQNYPNVKGSGYSKNYDVNDERVSRYNDGAAARGGYTESVNYGYGKRTGGKHQTGNLNGLNLGRQSAGYGDNYAHVGHTENDYRPAKNVYNGGYGYGVATGYGYDGYGHNDVHDWGSKSGWGANGWGQSKAWGHKKDKNGLSGLTGLKGLGGFNGFSHNGGFDLGLRGREDFRTLYDNGPDEYRGNEGDYIQGRHDVDDPRTQHSGYERSDYGEKDNQVIDDVYEREDSPNTDYESTYQAQGKHDVDDPSRFSHHYDGDRDSGEKDDRVVDDRFDPEDAELQYPNRGNRFITNPDNGINAPRFHANADNQGVGQNIGRGRGTFGQGYGFSNYSHTHDDSNAGFRATKFGGRNDRNRGQGDHAKRRYQPKW